MHNHVTDLSLPPLVSDGGKIRAIASLGCAQDQLGVAPDTGHYVIPCTDGLPITLHATETTTEDSLDTLGLKRNGLAHFYRLDVIQAWIRRFFASESICMT